MKDIKRKIARYNTCWEDKLTESRFWKAIALSYIEQDVKLEEQQIFITQISFYPRLIEVLLSTLNKANTKVTVNILFFSTLLPRHYWNFPMQFNYNGTLVSYVRSIEFLEKYREGLKKNIYQRGLSNVKLNIERVLFVAKDTSIKSFEDTELYTKSELENDFNYYCAIKRNNKIGDYAKKVRWKDLLNLKNPDGDLLVKKKYYLTGLKIDDDLISKILKSGMENDELYKLSKITNKGDFFSVGDYYIEQLHTNPNENAKHIVITNDTDSDPLDKGCYKMRDIPSLSPNLSYIEIKFDNEDDAPLSFILDTYMDIKRGFVKLEILDADDNKNRVLYHKIQEIRSKSVPIRRTSNENYIYDKKREDIIDEIKSYVNGNTVDKDLSQKVDFIENNIFNLSSSDIDYYRDAINNKYTKDVIESLYEKLSRAINKK